MIKYFRMENKMKQNHNHECACGCSAAYDKIDDDQFEKAFRLNILPKRHMVIATIAVIIITAIIALIFFIY
jgi:hypothetical protein